MRIKNIILLLLLVISCNNTKNNKNQKTNKDAEIHAKEANTALYSFEKKVAGIDELQEGQCVEKSLGAVDLGSGSFKAQAGLFEFCGASNITVKQIYKTESKFAAAKKLSHSERTFLPNIISNMIKTVDLLKTTLITELNHSNTEWGGVATAVFRDALNGADVINAINISSFKTNSTVVLLTQLDEGKAAFLSQGGKIPLWDAGGASSQLILNENKQISIPYGSTTFNRKIIEILQPNDDSQIVYPISQLPDFDFEFTEEEKKEVPKKFVVTGGLFENTIFAKVCEKPADCPDRTVTIDQVRSLLNKLIGKTKDELNVMYPNDTKFVDTYVTDFIFVFHIMKQLEIHSISSKNTNVLQTVFPILRGLTLTLEKLNNIEPINE